MSHLPCSFPRRLAVNSFVDYSLRFHGSLGLISACDEVLIARAFVTNLATDDYRLSVSLWRQSPHELRAPCEGVSFAAKPPIESEMHVEPQTRFQSLVILRYDQLRTGLIIRTSSDEVVVATLSAEPCRAQKLVD